MGGVVILWIVFRDQKHNIPGWVDGRIDRWVEGSKSHFKDCLQQSKTFLTLNIIIDGCQKCHPLLFGALLSDLEFKLLEHT